MGGDTGSGWVSQNEKPREFLDLQEAQSRFCRMLADLIRYAYGSGYELAVGPAYQDVPEIHRRSLHRRRLAMDFVLFRDGEQLPDTPDAHEELGKYWESIGGSWGGHYGEGNHYSLKWGGVV